MTYVVGIFEMSLDSDRFYKGIVIPLVAGWFGEINRDFEQTIVALAKETTAASDLGRTLSLLINTEKKEGAFLLMLQQFTRVIGVQSVRGNTMLKMSRLHMYVHYIEEHHKKAKEVHQANIGNNRYRPDKRD